MKLKLNNPKKQVSDFFTMAAGSISYPKNPYNIVWLIENATKEELNGIKKNVQLNYKEQALVCIENDRKLEIEDSIFLKAITTDRNIANRLENLVKEHGATLKNLGLAITKTNRILCLKKAIALGLDINYSLSGNNVLRNSIKTKKREMANILWNHPDINKNFLDNEYRNYAYHALEKINIELVKQIFHNNPELFLMRDKRGDTVFHALRVYRNTFKTKEKDIINLVIEIQNYTSQYDITLDTSNYEGLVPTNINMFLKEIQDEYIYRKYIELEAKIPNKELTIIKKKKL